MAADDRKTHWYLESLNVDLCVCVCVHAHMCVCAWVLSYVYTYILIALITTAGELYEDYLVQFWNQKSLGKVVSWLDTGLGWPTVDAIMPGKCMGVKVTHQEVRINPGVRLSLITNASFKWQFHESKMSGSDLIIYQKQCLQWPMDLPQVLLLKSPPLPMISPGDQVCNTGIWVWQIMSNILFSSSDFHVSHESVPIFILV